MPQTARPCNWKKGWIPAISLPFLFTLDTSTVRRQSSLVCSMLALSSRCATFCEPKPRAASSVEVTRSSLSLSLSLLGALPFLSPPRRPQSPNPPKKRASLSFHAQKTTKSQSKSLRQLALATSQWKISLFFPMPPLCVEGTECFCFLRRKSLSLFRLKHPPQKTSCERLKSTGALVRCRFGSGLFALFSFQPPSSLLSLLRRWLASF